MSSGKQSAFVRSAYTLVLPGSGSVGVGSVTLAKGRRQFNLVVDVTVGSSGLELTNPLFWLAVNGHPVPPISWMFTCPPNVQCLNSMTWWVDLDDLERQNPGEIIRKPLSIELWLGSEVPFPTTVSLMIVQIGAHLQAK